MSTLSLFEDDAAEEPVAQVGPQPMYDSQRAQIRRYFQQLQLTTAQAQFALVAELIGVRLTAVADLNADDAQRLIFQLQSRVQTSAREAIGNTWADRDEDTWIDKL